MALMLCCVLASFFAMVDLATVLPIWITYFFMGAPVEYDDISSTRDAFNFILRGAHTLRILRALRVHRNLAHIENEVNRFLCELGVSVLTMILFGTHMPATSHVVCEVIVHIVCCRLSSIGVSGAPPARLTFPHVDVRCCGHHHHRGLR